MQVTESFVQIFHRISSTVTIVLVFEHTSGKMYQKKDTYSDTAALLQLNAW